MAKSMQKKSNPKRQSNGKNGHKEADVTELRANLDALGLKIMNVTADGNCFFRALADQLEGDEDEYEKYRKMVVRFIKSNREMFEPFVEDEVPFDQYCRSMGKEGTWAGHVELHAASLVTRCNICIHKLMSPRWYIQNFHSSEARMIHLSYHDGEHYNSVRSKEDTCSGPARPFILKGGEAGLEEKSNQEKVDWTASKEQCGGNGVPEESIKQRLQVDLDVDSATEVLKSGQGFGDLLVNSSYDEDRDVEREQHEIKVEDNSFKQDLSGNNPEIIQNKIEKIISKTKACTHGSRKNNKSYCGSVAGKSSARIPVKRIVDCGKNRKTRTQVRRGRSAVANFVGSDPVTPDTNALCI